MLRNSWGVFWLAGLVLCLARTAEAQTPTVVVLDFAGHGGSTARVQVLRALRGQVQFKKNNDAKAIAARQSLQLGTDAGRRDLSEQLGVDYVFWGRVRGRGAAARTEIRVSGRSGKQLTGYEAGAPGGREGNALIQEAARTALVEAMELSPPGRERRRPTKVAPAVPSLPAAAPGAPEKIDAKSDEKDAKEQRREGSHRMPVFEILVGGGVRLLDIDFDVGTADGGTSNRRFDSGAFTDLSGYVLVRPLGRFDNPALQAIVIQLDAGLGVGLDAEINQSATSDINTWRVLGQVGYLYPVLKRLQVGGLVGVGVDSFGIDPNSTLPSRQYVYLRVGGAIGYTILEDFLTVRADGGFRWPFSLGDIEPAFGSDSTAIGFDAMATVGGRLDIGFTYAFRFLFEQYNLDFSGTTSSSQPSQSAGSGSGTDRAMTFQVLVGWTL